jgi:hypothetical protein
VHLSTHYAMGRWVDVCICRHIMQCVDTWFWADAISYCAINCVRCQVFTKGIHPTTHSRPCLVQCATSNVKHMGTGVRGIKTCCLPPSLCHAHILIIPSIEFFIFCKNIRKLFDRREFPEQTIFTRPAFKSV